MEGPVRSLPGLLSLFLLGMAFTLKKGYFMKFESFNCMATEKIAVVGCGDSY